MFMFQTDANKYQKNKLPAPVEQLAFQMEKLDQ